MRADKSCTAKLEILKLKHSPEAQRARLAGTSVDEFKYVGQICNFLPPPSERVG